MSSFTVFFTLNPGASNEVEVEVNGPSGSTDVAQLPKYVTDLTAAHTRIVYKLTATEIQQWTIALDNLTTSMKTAFQAFFDDNAEGPTNTFQYTHTDGTEYSNCRFIDTALTWTRNDNNNWNTVVRLELGTEVNS